MTRKMSVPKAQAVLQAYRENDHNAMKALPLAGYSRKTAQSQSGEVIQLAVKTVARAELENLARSDKSTAIAFAGLSLDDIQSEFLKIIKQDKDNTNKLKALTPLLRELGVRFDDEQAKQVAPVNITFKQNVVAQPSQVDNVAQQLLCDTIETAQPSPVDENRLGWDIGSPNGVLKEGERPTQKNSEIETIDKTEEVLPTTNNDNPRSDDIPDSFIN